MPKSSSTSATTKPPMPDLTEHEAEDVPLDDVLRKLLAAKPAVKPNPDPTPNKPPKE